MQKPLRFFFKLLSQSKVATLASGGIAETDMTPRMLVLQSYLTLSYYMSQIKDINADI